MTEGLWGSGAGEDAGGRVAPPLFEQNEFRGVELSPEFLADLDPRAFRQVFHLALTHDVFGREELLDTLAALLGLRTDLLSSVLDLLIAHEELWPWVKTFDPSTLCGFRRFTPASTFAEPQGVRFFVLLGSVIEARPEMAFTPDGRQFSSWLDDMLQPQEH